MLKQDEFFEYVKDHILEYMTDQGDKTVTIKEVTKNNQVVLHGLTIEDDMICVPILYLDHFYEKYEKGEDIGEILCRLGNIYDEQLMSEQIRFPIQYYEDYDKAREQIFFRVVNYEQNQEMLEGCPIERMEDLAITYRLLMNQDGEGMTSALVKNKDVDKWNITKETLFLDGRRNTKRLFPGNIKSLDEVLSDNFGLKIDEPSTLYVATNDAKINGASVIAYEDLLYEFAQKVDENLYILPSSIHEVLILKESDALDTDDMRQMIIDTNEQIVDAEEVLSNHLYYYNRAEDHLMICQ